MWAHSCSSAIYIYISISIYICICICICMLLYICICCCVQFRGPFFPMVSRMCRFLSQHETMQKLKKCFPMARAMQSTEYESEHVDSWTHIQSKCVQKQGGYVAQHKHTLERIPAAHFLNASFSHVFGPFQDNPKIRETPIFRVFHDHFRVVLGPPHQTEHQYISRYHKKITKEVSFVNKGGALCFSKEWFWNPYFCSVSCDNIEND